MGFFLGLGGTAELWGVRWMKTAVHANPLPRRMKAPRSELLSALRYFFGAFLDLE